MLHYQHEEHLSHMLYYIFFVPQDAHLGFHTPAAGGGGFFGIHFEDFIITLYWNSSLLMEWYVEHKNLELLLT